MSKTFVLCDGTISYKLVKFYYTTSPYTWKNDDYLTGMITTFIRFCHQVIHLTPFEFAKLGNYFCVNETDQNDPFGRNIQAANSLPK